MPRCEKRKRPTGLRDTPGVGVLEWRRWDSNPRPAAPESAGDAEKVGLFNQRAACGAAVGAGRFLGVAIAVGLVKYQVDQLLYVNVVPIPTPPPIIQSCGPRKLASSK